MLLDIVNRRLKVGATTTLHLELLFVLFSLSQFYRFALHVPIEHQHINFLDAIFEKGSDDAEVTSQLFGTYRAAGVDGDKQMCGEVIVAAHLLEATRKPRKALRKSILPSAAFLMSSTKSADILPHPVVL